MKVSTKRLSVLVVGASGGGYGAGIANLLETKGHVVYSMQRRPRFKQCDQNSAIPSDHWFEADLNVPAQTLGVVQKLVRQEVRLDAVIHTALESTAVEIELLNSFDLARAFQVNVIEPMMLMQYLFEFNAIKPAGRGIFFLDSRKLDFEYMGTLVSKACVQPAVTAFSQVWPSTFEHMFLVPPNEIIRGGDVLSETVLKLLTGDMTFPRLQTLTL